MLKIIVSGCNGHMGRVDGIAFQGGFIHKGGIHCDLLRVNIQYFCDDFL